MKNKDMPAMPTYDWKYEFDGGDQPVKTETSGGLTKREMFAMNAPDDVPSWYHEIFVNSTLMKDEYLWRLDGDGFSPSEIGLTDEGKRAIYFAWKVYYANKLLAELDK